MGNEDIEAIFLGAMVGLFIGGGIAMFVFYSDASDGEIIFGEPTGRFVRVDAEQEDDIRNWENCMDSMDVMEARWSIQKEHEAFLDELGVKMKCNFNYSICEYECMCFIKENWRRC